MNDAAAEIEFLTVEVVLALHQRQLERFGGGTGLREPSTATSEPGSSLRRSSWP
jgi:hypothetical protein